MSVAEHSISNGYVEYYGVPYLIHRYPDNVECVLPADEPNLPEENVLLSVVEDMQSKGALSRSTPTALGYDVRALYQPGWPNKGYSDIYYNKNRNEFIKVPTVIKKGAMQFFAMNALSRALELYPDVAAVRQRALVRNKVSRSTALFIEGATGVSASTSYNTLLNREDQLLFRQALADRVNVISRQIHPGLRRFINDTPKAHHSLGLGNIFFNNLGNGNVDPAISPLTFIDQAHPSIGAMLSHAVLRHVSVIRQ